MVKRVKTQTNSRPASGLEFLRSLAKQQSKKLRMSVLFGLLSTVVMISQWLSLAYLAHQIIIQHQSLDKNWPASLILLSSVLLRPIFLKFKNNYAQTASWLIRQHIRSLVLEHWKISSPLMSHHHSPAAAASQWVEEVEAMDGYFSQYWPQQMLAVLAPLLIIIPVFYLNWLCGMLLLISAPLIPLFMILVGLGAESVNQKYFVMRQRLAGHFLDRVKHLSTIKLFNAHQPEINDIKQKSDDYRKVIMQTLKIAFLSSTVLEFFTSVAIASVAIYIGFSLFGAITWGPSTELSLFSGFAILLLAPEFFQPLRNLSQFYHDRASALAASNNLVNLFKISYKSTNRLTGKTEEQGAVPPAYFHYQTPEQGLALVDLVIGHQHALQTPLNLTLQLGDIVSVSGPSGCGKSTLLNTLAGYLSPINGQLFIPTFDVHRPQIAYLPQQAWLIQGSVLNNIVLFNPAIDEEELNTVLQAVNLLEDIKQRDLGLSTEISEDGLGFSGGQSQRIALLRLMMAPTALIIMDEPTASLDTQNRQRVIEQIQKLAQNAIIVVATHDHDIFNIANHHVVLKAPLDATKGSKNVG